jgi:hypothetical protein
MIIIKYFWYLLMLGISFDKSLNPLNELALPFVLRGF